MKPKNSSEYRIGIVNPLILVGNEIKTILTEGVSGIELCTATVIQPARPPEGVQPAVGLQPLSGCAG